MCLWSSKHIFGAIYNSVCIITLRDDSNCIQLCPVYYSGCRKYFILYGSGRGGVTSFLPPSLPWLDIFVFYPKKWRKFITLWKLFFFPENSPLRSFVPNCVISDFLLFPMQPSVWFRCIMVLNREGWSVLSLHSHCTKIIKCQESWIICFVLK